MEPTAAELRRIRRMVAKREAKIKSVFDFLANVVSRFGTETKREVHSCHTSVITELRSVNGLSFKWSTGNTSMGGNDVQIFYAFPGRGRCLVFSMSYQQGFEDCKIGSFEQDLSWQKALEQVRRNPKKFFTEQRKKEERREKLAEARRQEEANRARLIKRAEDLNVL